MSGPRNAGLTHLFVLFTVFLTLGAVVAYLNRHHTEQQGNFYGPYVSMADHLAGVAPREELTYPMWGYPAVLTLLPDYEWVVAPQVLLSAVIMTSLLIRLRSDPVVGEYGRVITWLFIAALPWYLVHSVKWPLSFSASLALLGLLILDPAIRRASIPLACAAGVMLGLTIYFRSEFLLLPVFMVVVALATRVFGSSIRIPVGVAVACAATAWLLLVPWAIHFHGQTGRYSLMPSQRGIVAFISLGQLPGNPWGAVYADEYAIDYLKEKGITATSTSDAGDRYLFDEYVRRVKEHPGAFVAKVGWNAVVTLLQGFYPGEPRLSADEFKQITRLRQRFKALLLPTGGSNASAEGDSPGTRVYAAFVYWMAIKLFGAVFFVIATWGVIRALWRGMGSVLLLLLASIFAYQYLFVLALATEPRYFNGLFVALVPFFIIGCIALWRPVVGRLRPQPAAAAPR